MEHRRLRRYIARLPEGAGSYPDHVVKATTFRDALADKPLRFEPGEIPEPVAKLIRHPPAPNAWVPEVLMISLFKMIGDQHFEGRGGTPAFLEWVHEQNLALLGGPMYRILFALIRPSTLFYGIEKRWGAFRRGTELRILVREKGFSSIELTYAPFLHDEEGLLAVGTALRAACEVAGGKDIRLELREVGETKGRFELFWEL